MAKLVSNVYGEALFELAMEQGRLDEYMEEAKTIRQVLKDNPDFIQIMNHPKVLKEEKAELLETVFKGQVSDEMVGLLKMVVEKDHFSQTDSILQYFEAKVMDEKNIGVVCVSTPMELTDTQKEAVEKRLLETTSYVAFQTEYKVDADLIGGMVIQIGDRVVDSSVQSKLYQLTRELSKIQLKVGESAS